MRKKHEKSDDFIIITFVLPINLQLIMVSRPL